jgi:hypothetical protein
MLCLLLRSWCLLTGQARELLHLRGARPLEH